MAKAKRSRRQSSLQRQRGETGRPGRPAPQTANPGAHTRPTPQLVLGLCAALVLLTAAVYFPVTGHEFVKLDDPSYFSNNPHLDGELSLADVRRALLEPYFANWIPLTHLSIALDDWLHGARPGAVLATNAGLHALAGVLLCLALARLTGRLQASAFVAAVFLVHPLHVESVAWASSRKDVLVGVWWMATLLAYARYCERPGGGRYALVALGLALALLSKPTAVTLPCVLLLLDFWPLKRLGPAAALPLGGRRLWLEKLPLLAMVAAVSAVTWAVQAGAGAEQTRHVPFGYRLQNAVHSLAAYALDAVWPSGLAAFYPYPTGGFGAGELALSGALLLLVSGACVTLLRREPSLLVGWLWFVGTLVPTLGLVQVGLQARADRYTYLPLVGLALAAGFGLPGLVGPLRRAPRLAAALACGVVVGLALAAHAQVRLWRDTLTLFEHAAAVTADNYFAHQLVGNALRARGELARAERELRLAVRIKPESDDARIDLASLLLDSGRVEQARSQLARVQANGADTADFHAVMGLAADREGRVGEAIAGYRAALERQPTHREAANNLAWLLATSADAELRDPEQALRLARAVLARDPDDALVLDTLAAAQAAAGRPGEALRTQARALALLSADVPPALRAELERRLADYRSRAGAASARD
jgi:tetratricopeptide (TPR) repeat protein